VFGPLHRHLLRVRRRLIAQSADSGMATAEYAVATVAACGFAGLLYRVLTSAQIYRVIDALITHALHML
jgi:hypothetical protein